MRTNVAIYIAIAIANLALNGVALLRFHDLMASPAGLVTAALVFNLCILPIVLFGAYRSGGIVEDISIRQATTAQLAAAATEARNAKEQSRPEKRDTQGQKQDS